jgi:hypothetical protein
MYETLPLSRDDVSDTMRVPESSHVHSALDVSVARSSSESSLFVLGNFFDFAVYLVCREVDKARRNIRQQRLEP